MKNVSFSLSFLTEDWTKKEWALNLIPLGGLSSVAYEVGSACLASKDRPAKISEEFFRSPFQTTVKKIAQCLWVPVVVCGALKLVCLIVKACWNRCFPPLSKELKEKELATAPQVTSPPDLPIWTVNHISKELKEDELATALQVTSLPDLPIWTVNHIFSYLNLHELGVSRRVSKRWREQASTPSLWQVAVYRELAFNSQDWAQFDADLVKGIDRRQEMLSLPKNIAEELKRSAFAGKNIKETHVLVRLPKGLTVNKLGELAKKYFPISYGYISSEIVNELESKTADESVWLLMTKNVLPKSLNKSYPQQETFIAELAETTGVPYQIPTILEAMTCRLAQCFSSKNRFYNEDEEDIKRCQEKVQGNGVYLSGSSLHQIIVTSCSSHWHNHFIRYMGVAALRKL